MPLVEVVPGSVAAATPGWAYVPDTGYSDPSKAALAPSGSRKRARASVNYNQNQNQTQSQNLTDTGGNVSQSSRTPTGLAVAEGGDGATAREQARRAKRLGELDRENHRDVQIVVPGRPKDVAHRGVRAGDSKKAMTPAVRRALLSNKTWRNHLDDEEAALAQQPAARGGVASASKQQLQLQQSSSQAAMDVDAVDLERSSLGGAAAANPAVALDAATEALIRVDTPAKPTAAELEALLSAPPLRWTAARASPSTSTAPPRRFCDVCGYWGLARCGRCGARVCGLECRRAHDEARCPRFFA